MDQEGDSLKPDILLRKGMPHPLPPAGCDDNRPDHYTTLGWAKIIRPATVWRTRVTMTSSCSLR